MIRQRRPIRKSRRWVRNGLRRVVRFKLTYRNASKVGGVATGLISVSIEFVKLSIIAFRHLIRLSGYFLITVVFIPVVLIVRLLKPLVRVRVGFLDANRMGHFSVDIGTYLVERNLVNSRPKSVDLLFFRGKPCNEQLVKMCRREMRVSAIFRYFWWANWIVPFGASHRIIPAIERERVGSRDTRGLFYNSNTMLEFSEPENIAANKFLDRIGFGNCQYFICLNVRDDAYLRTHMKRDQWDYHSYRDSDIESYRSAALLLANKGYGILRMGKKVEKEFNSSHPLIIDYANSPLRTDFLDVWLMANCFFCISVGSGLDSVADIFRVPTVMVNFIPMIYLHTWQFAITAPKRLYWEHGLRQELTLSEMLAHGHSRTEEYQRAGIKVVDLDQEQISDAVAEMEERLTKTYKETPIEKNRQAEFWKIFRSGPRYRELHDFIHPSSYISKKFIGQNPEWLN